MRLPRERRRERTPSLRVNPSLQEPELLGAASNSREGNLTAASRREASPTARGIGTTSVTPQRRAGLHETVRGSQLPSAGRGPTFGSEAPPGGASGDARPLNNRAFGGSHERGGATLDEGSPLNRIGSVA